MAGPIIKVTVAGDAAPLNVAMGQASRTLEKFGGDAVAAADAVIAANVKQRESLEALSKQYAAVAASAKVGSKEQVAAAELSAASQKTLQREMGTTTATMEKTRTSALSLSKVMNTALGFSILGIGIGSTVKAAETFQQQMKLIQTQAGASAGEVKRMSNAVMGLAGQVATAPEELAKGLYHIESTGQRGAKALEELKVAAEGAKIGGANLEDVTNALNATIVSGIKGAGDYSNAMGILNATVGAGDMRMQDLADAMGTGLPAAAKIYGVSLRDISGALAVFGDNNIRGADAGTKLTSAIRLMAAPSKAAAKELAGLGIGATQLGTDLRTGGLPKALQDLKSHMEAMGLSAEQQAVVLTRAFGGRQAGGILLLMGQLDRLKTKIKEVGDGGNSFGAQWEATQKTAAFSMDRFHASLKLLEITIGNELIPAVSKVANSFSDWITKAQKTGELKRDIDQVKEALGAIGGVLKIAKDGFDALNKITGSTKTSVELLVGAFLAFKTLSFASGVIAQLRNIGIMAGESGAAGDVGVLQGKLNKLKGIGRIAIPVTIGYVAAQGLIKAQAWLDQHATFGNKPASSPLTVAVKAKLDADAKAIEAAGGTVAKNFGVGFANGNSKNPPDWNLILKFADAEAAAAKAGIAAGKAFAAGLQKATGGIDIKTGLPSSSSPFSSGFPTTATTVPGSKGALSPAQIAALAKGMGLDAKAVLAVAKTEGLGGGIGDGGHAFGPFQMNNAGGVLTGKFPGWTKDQIQAWAWSAEGVKYALAGIQKAVGNLKGYAAIHAQVYGFERPMDKPKELAAALANYGVAGVPTADNPNAAGTTGTSGLTHAQLVALGLADGGKGGKGTKAPAFKVPQELVAKVKTAAEAFKTAVTQQHLATLDGLLAQEEALLKKHGDVSAAASVAALIVESKKKLADTFAKIAKKDEQDAAADIKKAQTAFAKGDFGSAATYVKAEVKSLTDAKKELQKAVAAAPAGAKAAYEKQLAAVTKELRDTKGVASWVEGVAKVVGKFTAALAAEGAQATALLQTRTAESEMQAVGYFNDTADVITGQDLLILKNLENQRDTLAAEQTVLQAKLASAPAALKAGLQARLTAIAGKVTGVAASITSAMGTIEQDLASAVTTAQGKFNTAIDKLQSDLNSQLQTLAEQASGYTADQAALDAMQLQDTQQGLNDSLAQAQKQLADDIAKQQASPDTATAQAAVNAAQAKLDSDKQAKAAQDVLVADQNDLTNATKALKDIINQTGAVTDDQITADKKAVDQAQRALDENALQTKAAAEQKQATQDATEKQKTLTDGMADLDSQLLSGKITADQFKKKLGELIGSVGLNVSANDALISEFALVASAASGVESAFNALITWVNKQTGSNIPQVGGSASSSSNPFPPGANTTVTGGPGGGGFNVPVGSDNSPSNIKKPGLQMAMGGIAPLHAFSGIMVPGAPHASDYVPALLNGGEMILNAGQQMQLWKLIQGAGPGGAAHYWPTPKLGGGHRGGGSTVVQHFHIAGTVVAEKELMQLIRTQSARATSRGTTVFGPN